MSIFNIDGVQLIQKSHTSYCVSANFEMRIMMVPQDRNIFPAVKPNPIHTYNTHIATSFGDDPYQQLVQ